MDVTALQRRTVRVLIAFLRPDPLSVAIAPEHVRAPKAPLRAVLAPPAAITGLATIVMANLVMVAVMAMAPVHMAMEGHDLRFVGLVISLHVAGMFAPAPLTGWLTDRLGPLAVAGAVAAAALGPMLIALARRGAPDDTVRAARMLA